MKKISKLLAVLLAITMIVSLLPIVAYAEEETAEPAAETVETVEAPAEEAPAAEAPAETPAEAPAEEAPAETPAEAPKAEETPAEEAPKTEEAPAEAKKEETPAVTLETAEKEEPLTGAMEDTATEADAYWSYTTEDGTETHYYAHIAEAYAKGVHADTNATSETAGVIKMLKDQTVDQTEPNATGSNSAGTESAATLTTSATSTGVALIDYPFKAINIDFNGHTLTVNTDKTATNGDARATLVRVGKTNVEHNYNIHIYSSAATPGTFTKNANKQSLRGLVGDYNGAGTGQRNITVENMNVTTVKNEPLILVGGTENNVTIRNCTFTSPTANSYATIETGIPTLTTNPTVVTNIVIENSTINGGKAAIRVANCKTTAVATYTTNCTCTLTLNGTNTFTCSATGDGASKHGILIATNTSGAWAYNIDPTTVATADSGAMLGWSDETVGTTLTTTVTEVNGAVYTVAFDLGDNPASADPQEVAEGYSPSLISVPAYEDGGTFYRFTYWSIEGDPTHYSSSTDVTVNDDVVLVANYETFSPVASCTIAGNTNYYDTLTEAWSSATAKTATIDLYQNVAFDYDTAEKGNATSTSHTWFDQNNNTFITLNLNGHTIDGGTDDTAYGTSGNKYFDRGIFRFNFSTNGNYALTINGGSGEIITRGIRSIFVFGSTGDSASVNSLNLTINDTTMRVTNDCNAGDADRANTTNFFQDNLKSDALGVYITLNGCDLICEYDETMKNSKLSYVFCNYNFSNTGVVPVHYEANNCTFENINQLTNRVTSFTASSVTYNTVAEQQVTFDAATAYEIMTDETMAGKVNNRVRIDAANYDPAIEKYILNPQQMVAGASEMIFELAAVSMSLDDYVYVNVKTNDAWTADYKVTTSLTNEAVDCNGESQISNLAIAAKDMGTSFVITAFADPDATTRYLSGTAGSIDTFAGLTKTAATGAAADELIAAMDALMLYGDWAAYNFGATSTAPADVEPFDTTGIAGEMAVEGKSNTNTGKAGYYGVSSVLDEQIYLKHYFYMVPELTEANAVVTDSASAVVDTVIRGDDGSGKFGFVKIKLAPKNFLEQYTVAVTSASETYTVTGSFADYAVQLTTVGATDTEKTLAVALLQYCAAAAAYFSAVSA